MHRRRNRIAASAIVAAASVLSAPLPSHAAPKDAAAQKLQKEAMESDYLGANFAGAESKLQKAIKACGESGCAPAVLAKLQRDLGVVYVVGLAKPAEGKAAFAAAMKADPKVALDKDFTTPEVQKAWDEAKKKGAAATTEESEEEEEEEAQRRES